MADEILQAAGNIRISYLPVNGIANLAWATPAELNAGIPIEDLLDLADLEPFVQASDTETTNPVGSKSPVEVRASSQYGGSLTVPYPGYKLDMANLAAVVYNLLKEQYHDFILVWSIDGELGDSGQAEKNNFQTGDFYSAIRVWADAWDDMITGEERFTYTRELQRGGGLVVNHVVAPSSGAPALVLTGTGLSGTVGDYGVITATVEGREFTRGVRYSTDDPEVATVSRNGVVTMTGTGTATITATLPGYTPVVTDTTTVTVT